MSSECEEKDPLPVTFFPPLHLQRRIWVLEILRRENVASVLDLGCGEGQLLVVLSQPAWLLAPIQDLESTTPVSPSPKDDVTNLHCTRIAGLDISGPDLDFAAESTAPPQTEDSAYVRWEPLKVEVWKGGLEAYNPGLVDMECIVSSEVIEHLTEDVLPEYAPMVLGVYRPRLFLVTTPSYTFNARFAPPGEYDPVGWADPTGRTTRIFRHSDHKFEWTQEEFAQWCEDVAREWGYSVSVSSVGRAQEDDPWGRDDELGGASQVAEFRKLDDEASAEKRDRGREQVLERAKERVGHELLVTHNHTAHPLAGKSASVQEIADAVKRKMISFREVFLRLEELWFERDISTLCGGWMEQLVQAIESDERFELYKGESKTRSGWRVGLVGGLGAEETQDMESWQPESVGDVSVDPFDSWEGGSGQDHSQSEDQSDSGETEKGEGSEQSKEDTSETSESEGWGSNSWEAANSGWGKTEDVQWENVLEDSRPWGSDRGWGDEKVAVPSVPVVVS